MTDPSYTAAEVDAALSVLTAPGRLNHAQDIVVHAAPALQRVLGEALAEGGWFGQAHDAEIARVAREDDEKERITAVDTLVADQTRLGMFVGVAVGFELARELSLGRESGKAEVATEPGKAESVASEPGRREFQKNQTTTQDG